MRTRSTARLLVLVLAAALGGCPTVGLDDAGPGDGAPGSDVSVSRDAAGTDAVTRDVPTPPSDTPALDARAASDVPGATDAPPGSDVPRFDAGTLRDGGARMDAGTPTDVVRVTDTGPMCGAGQLSCGTPPACVNPQSDPRNCGRCATACTAAQMCSAGSCVTTCAPPSVVCTTAGGMACVNTQTDATHCGRCNNPCAAGQVCRAGACMAVSTCPPGQTMCGTRCVTTATDPANCGACGTVCTDGRGCSGATCNWNEVLVRVNAARAAPRVCGTMSFPATTALTGDARLDAAAMTHTRDMTGANFFSHTGSDGSTVGVRVTRAGYTWTAVGENIAAGQRTAQEVVDGWLASPGHCSNIMSANFRHMGIAALNCATCTYPIYWTQDFGRP
jgi:uncharacterized protein YkwD